MLVMQENYRKTSLQSFQQRYATVGNP